jgi:citrate lyase subunit beta/citryl-CoA lyase
MKLIRSLLCVPAHKPELYEKAARSAADCLMFDLEDSTPAQHKNAAFTRLGDYLRVTREEIDKIIAVRVNPGLPGEAATFAELADVLVVPKVAEAFDLLAYDRFVAPALLPVIETPAAIMNLRHILSLPSVVGGIFGVADYAAGMGVSDRVYATELLHSASPERVNRRFGYAKQKLATYARAFGKQALDTCFWVKGPDVPSVVEWAWTEARGLGFTGAACIHPVQVPPANEVFGPSFLEQQWATRTHADHAARNGEVGVDAMGMVVGLPVDRQAQAILGRSAR